MKEMTAREYITTAVVWGAAAALVAWLAGPWWAFAPVFLSGFVLRRGTDLWTEEQLDKRVIVFDKSLLDNGTYVQTVYMPSPDSSTNFVFITTAVNTDGMQEHNRVAESEEHARRNHREVLALMEKHG